MHRGAVGRCGRGCPRCAVRLGEPSASRCTSRCVALDTRLQGHCGAAAALGPSRRPLPRATPIGLTSCGHVAGCDRCTRRSRVPTDSINCPASASVSTNGGDMTRLDPALTWTIMPNSSRRRRPIATPGPRGVLAGALPPFVPNPRINGHRHGRPMVRLFAIRDAVYGDIPNCKTTRRMAIHKK